MGDEGCEVVCDSLRSNANLTRLHLAANGAGRVGVIQRSALCSQEEMNLKKHPAEICPHRSMAFSAGQCSSPGALEHHHLTAGHLVRGGIWTKDLRTGGF
jgi:hypothetical protein